MHAMHPRLSSRFLTVYRSTEVTEDTREEGLICTRHGGRMEGGSLKDARVSLLREHRALRTS